MVVLSKMWWWNQPLYRLRVERYPLEYDEPLLALGTSVEWIPNLSSLVFSELSTAYTWYQQLSPNRLAHMTPEVEKELFAPIIAPPPVVDSSQLEEAEEFMMQRSMVSDCLVPSTLSSSCSVPSKPDFLRKSSAASAYDHKPQKKMATTSRKKATPSNSKQASSSRKAGSVRETSRKQK